MSTDPQDQYRRLLAAAAVVLVVPVAIGLHSLTSVGRTALAGWTAQDALQVEPSARSVVLGA